VTQMYEKIVAFLDAHIGAQKRGVAVAQ